MFDDPIQTSNRVSKMPGRNGESNICESLELEKLRQVNLIEPTGLMYNTARTRRFLDLEISQGISICTWNVF